MAVFHIMFARLALVAMLASALVPAGFMPQWGESGLVISICSPGTAQTTMISPDSPIYSRLAELNRRMQGDTPLDKQPIGHDEAMPDCAFSGAGIVAVLAHDAGYISAIFPQQMTISARKNLAAFLSEAVLPPATGPPLFFHSL